jgi:hypothetical protein
MKGRRFDILVIALGIALLLGVAYFRNASQSSSTPSVYSTYDSGPRGYRALYEVLRAEGKVSIVRSERDLSLLDPSVDTLVISSIVPDTSFVNPRPAKPLDDRDLKVLKSFVTKGGRLVVLATDIGGSEDARLGLPAVHEVKDLGRAESLSPARTPGVRSVQAPTPVAFPFDVRKATPLLANAQGLIAIAYPLGKGEVIAIAAPQIVSNRYLAKADNARFAYDVLAGRGAVAFDERIHGYVEDKSFWDALPPPVHVAIWITVGLVLLALFGANVRFAPPLAVDRPDERDSAAYVEAMAGLLRRARAARSAIAAFADDALRRARIRYGVPASGGVDAIAPRIDRDDVRCNLVALERLRALEHPDDVAVTRAAVVNARLRKDLG